MMKKILLVIMLLILATSVQGAFTTQVAGTIGTLTGVGSLSGADLTVSITSTDGATTYVSGAAVVGTYTAGMTLLSPSVSLNYSSTYTYKLHHSTYGDFRYNFTTPITPGTSGYTYGDNSASKVLTTATGAGNVVLPSISDVKTGVTYGSASSLTGTYAGATLTWSASSYITSYDCSMYDNLAGTPLSAESSATLCGYDENCVWTGTACTGTPSGLSTINWYAGTLACYNSPEGSLPAGTWRLPDESQLFGRLSDEYVILTQPKVFIDYVRYWSSSTISFAPSYAWGGGSGDTSLYVYDGNKSYPGSRVRCLH